MALFHLSNRRLSGSFGLGRHGEKQRGAERRPAGDDQCRRGDLLRRAGRGAGCCHPQFKVPPDLRSSGLQRASRRLDPAVHRPVSDFHLFPFLGRKPN